ncbi:hypothetical protein NKH28_03945 [Mesorhizobium sp. M1227]|uniref:hypothetical protein n=1 Tax=Mesorhizobium sp. M1227 TaxID=2957071 RepID=UPI00333BC1A3
MDAKLVELSGRVVRENVDSGSKSERDAVVLKTDQGDSYVLRRKDGPSFGDGALDSLVGSSIHTHGVALGNTLIMREWQIK